MTSKHFKNLLLWEKAKRAKGEPVVALVYNPENNEAEYTEGKFVKTKGHYAFAEGNGENIQFHAPEDVFPLNPSNELALGDCLSIAGEPALVDWGSVPGHLFIKTRDDEFPVSDYEGDYVQFGEAFNDAATMTRFYPDYFQATFAQTKHKAGYTSLYNNSSTTQVMPSYGNFLDYFFLMRMVFDEAQGSSFIHITVPNGFVKVLLDGSMLANKLAGDDLDFGGVDYSAYKESFQSYLKALDDKRSKGRVMFTVGDVTRAEKAL